MRLIYNLLEQEIAILTRFKSLPPVKDILFKTERIKREN